jgi:hypothetical protein
MLNRNVTYLLTLSCLLTFYGCKTGNSALVKDNATNSSSGESAKSTPAIRYSIENNEVLASRCSQTSFEKPTSWNIPGCEVIGRMGLAKFKEKAIYNYLKTVERTSLNDREKFVIESVIKAKQHLEAAPKELKSLRELSMEQVDHVIASYTHIQRPFQTQVPIHFLIRFPTQYLCQTLVSIKSDSSLTLADSFKVPS